MPRRLPTMRLAHLLAVGCLLLTATGPAARAGQVVPAVPAGDILERVVIVERHGVRVPGTPPPGLAAEAWPDWPVAAGELTPHGAGDMRLMGSWMRRTYAGQGLLPAQGCPADGEVTVWADGHDHRTRQSGDALLDGMFPGCGLAARHGPAGMADPLFDGLVTGACPLDPDQAQAAVTAALSDGPQDPVPGYRPALAALAGLLDPAAAHEPCPGNGVSCLATGANRVVATARDARLKGPLATGAALVETLGLEYDQGMTGAELGWGRLMPATLDAIMPLRNGYSALTRANPVIASHNGAPMAGAVLAAIDGRPPQSSGKDAKLVVFLGHDTTLANMAGILGLRWTLPGQPDALPPGAALVFAVYRGRDPADRWVRLALTYQTADQLRSMAPLDDAHPPGRVELQPDACRGAAAGCGVDALRRIVAASVPAQCMPTATAP